MLLQVGCANAIGMQGCMSLAAFSAMNVIGAPCWQLKGIAIPGAMHN